MQFDQNNTSENRNKKLVLSIITVVRNGDKILENTILNVLNQTYPSIEYIIIDGGSTDKTIDVIKKHEVNIDYWSSEPDKGIYDAMNKGIMAATGEWVNFMNAGDEFYDLKTCESIADFIKYKRSDLIYGDFLAVSEGINSNLLVKARPLKTIYTGMAFCHQSVFVKRELLISRLFDTRYKIAADYNQMLSLYREGYIFSYIEKTLSRIKTAGISYSNIDTLIETMKAIHAVEPYSLKLLYFVPKLGVSILRSLLAPKLANKIRKYKWEYLKFKNSNR